ncbi:MAG: ferrous iron transporter B [Bacteroidetes bacterium]|nr:MAG: ferrous iron transporter B [Bacteroidota bacterium]
MSDPISTRLMIFVPQIALLSAFISMLEETGYMARVMFIMDKLMQKFGLNGKSVIPLISGVACAIPAIMAARGISVWKERLITIMITPLMSCSARLPIYAIMIALVVPDQSVFIFNLQGVVLMGMYVLGFAMALLAAWVMNKMIKAKERSFFIMELPVYQVPRWENVGISVFQKTQAFVLEAGKVILAISIILWALASYSFSGEMEKAEQEIRQNFAELPENELSNKIASKKLEVSFAGKIGHLIEPLVKPLGYDWKISIALITSFAAREVFVGTMSTIYSLGDEEDESTVKERMKKELNPDTKKPFYTPAVGFSLLVFYAFAMQCMSTMAVVYKETLSWKYPIILFVYMTALAYLSAFLVFQLMK